MFGQELILRTKLIPPRTRRWTLVRPRLYQQLDRSLDYRLTLLEAPTGYGKTTTLAGWLAAGEHPYVWYSLGTVETDPLVLLLHLIYAFRSRFPLAGRQALEMLGREREQGEAGRVWLAPALHLLVNDLCDQLAQETYLVLDDFHLLEGRAESRALLEELATSLPPRLHLIIASRSRVELIGLARWQAQGEVLRLNKDDLAFQSAETWQLFQEHYGLALSTEQATWLTNETEGWVIALQMFWQSSSHETLSLAQLPPSLPGLFNYLAQEVLNRQTLPDQEFLLGTSILRRLRPDLCAAVLQRSVAECENRLQTLSEAGLFLTPTGDEISYRYHHLFAEFLNRRLQDNQLDSAYIQTLHHRAAEFCERDNRLEDAIGHWLTARQYTEAARLLENSLADQLLTSGRLERLEEVLNQFPANLLSDWPGLSVYLGDCYRLTSRFEAALNAYQEAADGFNLQSDRLGRARARRGAALVYIDTVQPAQAEELLEEALALVNHSEDRSLQAALLRNLAENKINRGRPLEAEGLFRQARALLNQPENPAEDVRIYLRTGRLVEARQALEGISQTERRSGLARAGRNHREALLLLSLIDSMQGYSVLAVEGAEEGIKLAQELRTPFTEAVAWQRLGHAFTVAGRTQEAGRAYNIGAELSDRLQVRRLRAEGFMGLCALEGRPEGDLGAARQASRQGLLIARQAGDRWIEGFITLTLGGALVQHGPVYFEEARQTVQAARQLLEDCGDRFGSLAGRFWLYLLDPRPEGLTALRQECEQNEYCFLLEQPTLFGLKDPTALAVFKSDCPTEVNYRLNRSAQLKITALGSFVVRRPDGSELTNRDWQREKARQLFQLLLTLRDKPLPKEQILDLLWPESDFAAAEAGFKVALNALTRALEPARPNRVQSSYILKTGSGNSLAYSLDLKNEKVWFDLAQFEQLVRQARQLEQVASRISNSPATATQLPEQALQSYRQAIELYKGDYLPACLYDDWAAPERERLLSLFLTTAERLAQARLACREWEQCLALCQLILARDNCWEEAYRLTMLAYHHLGNRTAALRTYERCSSALADELDIEPMPQTTLLYQEILNA